MFAYKSSRSYFCRTPARHANHHQLWDATEKGGELLAPFVPPPQPIVWAHLIQFSLRLFSVIMSHEIRIFGQLFHMVMIRFICMAFDANTLQVFRIIVIF